MNAEVVQRVIQPVHAVKEEQRNHDEQRQLADAALHERECARAIHPLLRNQSERHCDDREENEHRTDQRRKHSARAEQRPEDRLVRALHRYRKAKSSSSDAMTAATAPLATIARSETRRPPSL